MKLTRRDFLKYTGVAIAIITGLGCTSKEVEKVKEKITIGALFDLTGPTADVGKDYALGVQDYVRYINETGGIDGVLIDLQYIDYGYKVPEALSAYKIFKDKYKVPAIIGWGTGDTNALKSSVARDKIVYISASYSAKLTDPRKAPYNFIAITDYTTQLRSVLKYARDNWDKNRSPRIVFTYPNVEYGTDPIEGGKAFAKELGYEIGNDEIVDLKATSAMDQLQRIKSWGADFIWIGGTISSASVIIRNARDLGMDVTFMVNCWGWDSRIVELAGDAAEGHYYNWPGVLFGDNVEGMKPILEMHEKYHPNDRHTIHYIKGWLNAMVVIEGIRRLVKNGEEITGENIKYELEKFRNWDPQGLAQPISYYPDDHRPSLANNIYTIKNEKIKKLATIDLEKEYGRRKDWLGV
ncbi:MAG TPA: ABC transporter substrate-binding protein [Archaeoglobus profundus]|nr:ABC transporter substrate-binding protein [Archaeoglobus profundus]HIP58030.1 ABC transporter substrate-binding protein [Archaeoglobus profundus]